MLRGTFVKAITSNCSCRGVMPGIDLFRLYILLSQYKSRDNTQEDWFVVLLIKKSACKRECACMHSF